MTRHLTCAALLATLAVLAGAAQAQGAGASTASDAPGIAPPASTAAPAGTGRFIIEGITAADRRTRLVWQRCSVGQRLHRELGCVGLARKLWFAEARQLEDSTWRLPTLDELRTLFDERLQHIADSDAFPDAPNTWYWAWGPDRTAAAMGVSCGSGGNDSCYQADARAVRLVRRTPATWVPK